MHGALGSVDAVGFDGDRDLAVCVLARRRSESERLGPLRRFEVGAPFSAADVTERRFWKQYRRAYEHCLSATSTKAAPWHIVPADDKKSARLIVSQVLVETMKALRLSFPKPDDERKKELQAFRKALTKRA